MADPMTQRLIEALYVEAMVLADEARSYFDERGRLDREQLPPEARVSFSCESLRVTTRLMQVIAWLLTRKAVATGEISVEEGRAEDRRLGEAGHSDPAVIATLPDAARAIVNASLELYNRVQRIDAGIDRPVAPVPSPARGLLDRLERHF